MKVTLLGSANTVFFHSYAKYLKNLGYDVMKVNTNNTHFDKSSINLYEHDNVSAHRKFSFNLIVRYLFRLLRIESLSVVQNFVEMFEAKKRLTEKEKNKLNSIINEHDTDIVLFFWGTTLRKELDSIRDNGIKKVLIVNTYPVRTKFEDHKDNPSLDLDTGYFNCFNGLVMTSKIMESFFKDSGFLGNAKYDVIPDFLDVDTPVPQENSSVEKKSMIFLGNTNFSERKIDDVSAEIVNIADSGIKVYIQKGGDSIQHPNIKFFPPFSLDGILNGELLGFIKNFDGVLFYYNGVNTLRYNMSVTTRLILAESAGVPVYFKGVVPKFLEEKNLDIEVKRYNDASDLKNMINLGNNKKPISKELIKVRMNKFKNFLECVNDSR